MNFFWFKTSDNNIIFDLRTVKFVQFFNIKFALFSSIGASTSLLQFIKFNMTCQNWYYQISFKVVTWVPQLRVWGGGGRGNMNKAFLHLLKEYGTPSSQNNQITIFNLLSTHYFGYLYTTSLFWRTSIYCILSTSSWSVVHILFAPALSASKV